MKELGYGHDYLYPHDFEGAIVKQDYLPEELKDRPVLIIPRDRGHEKQLKAFMEKVRRVFYRDQEEVS